MLYFYLVLSIMAAHTSDAVPNPIRTNANGVIAQGGFDMARKFFALPQSIVSTDTTFDSSACMQLYSAGYLLESNNIEPDAYDTLRLFMEHCTAEADKPTNYLGFRFMTGAVSGWNAGGVGRWNDYLTWLKSVLYLNTDSGWYCQDVQQMFIALQSDVAAKQAVYQYLIYSGKCGKVLDSTWEAYNKAEYGVRYHNWLDSVLVYYSVYNIPPSGLGKVRMDDSINADTLAHPFDTTSETLTEANLQILLGQQFGGISSPSPSSSVALLSAQLMENPTQTNEIGVSYQMGRTALVSMQLLDILGKSIPITNAKYQLQQPGTHEATLPVPNLPPGTYYLRLSTDAGEAITLKVIKE